jgi:hypothetical protein
LRAKKSVESPADSCGNDKKRGEIHWKEKEERKRKME